MREVLLICLVLVTWVGHVGCRLELVDNGYEDLHIVIKKNVKEDSQLLTRIRNVFTELSSKMYTATRRRAYIRNVNVVIPKSWNSDGYEFIPDVTTKSQLVIIARKKKGYKKAPYVTGNVECGKGGRALHVTPEFLLREGETPFGPHDSVLLHEWGHLRWGLFEEYPSVKRREGRGKRQYVQFYRSEGEWKPVSCTRDVPGQSYRNCNKQNVCNIAGLTEVPTRCLFCPDNDPNVKTSLMGHQWLPGLDSFCDRDHEETESRHRHNSEAPNLQNVLCKGLSAWEVMRQHEDFANDANPPGPDGRNTTPNFRFLQKSGRVRIFVMDVSGSMQSNQRILRQEQAVRLVIGTLVERRSRVGMVKFSTDATILAGLTEIRTKDDRQELIQQIPTETGGGTSIGSGLRKALEILDSINKRLCEIILITDGENTDPPSINDVRSEVISAGVVVHTIAVSQNADRSLAKLAEDTGGVSLIYLDSQTISFADALSQVISPASSLVDDETPETLLSLAVRVSPTNPASGQFTIDAGLGNDTTLTTMSDTATDVELSVTGPNGFTYQRRETGKTMAVFEIGADLSSGAYLYTITASSDVYLNVYVTSKPQSEEAAVLHVTSWLSKQSVDYVGDTPVTLHAEVLRDDQPVLGATVQFILEPSPIPGFAVKMNDRGSGADTVGYDGIYSAYLVNSFFKQNGRYNIKILVNGDESTFTWTTTSGSKSIINPDYADEEDYYEEEVEEIIGPFDRLSLPGELLVTNFNANHQDNTPPARIHDLQIQNTTTTNTAGVKTVTFTFTWTAVGDDMDVGQAAKYEFFLAKNLTSLQGGIPDDGDMVNITNISPKDSGQDETLTFVVSRESCSGTCYFGLRAVDGLGNKGDLSNVLALEADYSAPYSAAPRTLMPFLHLCFVFLMGLVLKI